MYDPVQVPKYALSGSVPDFKLVGLGHRS